MRLVSWALDTGECVGKSRDLRESLELSKVQIERAKTFRRCRAKDMQRYAKIYEDTHIDPAVAGAYGLKIWKQFNDVAPPRYESFSPEI